MTKDDKEFILSSILVVFGLYITYLSLNIDVKSDFVESAAIFPLIISVSFTLFSSIYFIKSLKSGGKPNIQEIKKSLISMYKEPYYRQVSFAIALVAVYIFIGVTYLSFYISSFIFMSVILILFVKRVKVIVSLLSSLLVTAVIYLIFSELFRIPIN
ncbi:MAG: hypothetical protein JM58_00780 [Peptococcaceae bacterium BICA1-8]|nr:MAG: hypothetical protein JM58_00780 [Peptococcaceae bacterium BICA1-8]